MDVFCYIIIIIIIIIRFVKRQNVKRLPWRYTWDCTGILVFTILIAGVTCVTSEVVGEQMWLMATQVFSRSDVPVLSSVDCGWNNNNVWCGSCVASLAFNFGLKLKWLNLSHRPDSQNSIPYVYGTFAVTADDALLNCWTQVQNFNYVPCVNVVVRKCAFIDCKQRAKCHLHFITMDTMWYVSNLVDHPQSGMVYSFSHVCVPVCVSVCPSDGNFQKFWCRRSYLHIWYVSRKYESSLCMNVIGSRSRLQKHKTLKIPIPAM